MSPPLYSLFIAWGFIVFQQFSIWFPLFLIALKIHTCKLLKTTMFNNSALIISTRTAASPTVVHKKHGKMISLHFYGDKHYHACPFFLCTSLPLKGTRIPPGTLRPGWQHQDHSGYAQCETQATGITPAHAEPPSCLHSLTAVAVWWKKYIYINHVALLLQGLSLPVVPLSIKTTTKKKTPKTSLIRRRFFSFFFVSRTDSRAAILKFASVNRLLSQEKQQLRAGFSHKWTERTSAASMAFMVHCCRRCPQVSSKQRYD